MQNNIEIRNPATGEVDAVIPVITASELDTAVALLKKGQLSWAKVPLQQRLDRIIAFGQLILANKQELAEILTKETGKPITQSLNEIVGAQNRIEHLRTNASKWLSEELITTTGATHEKIVYEPLGLIANISAWNFPYNVGFNVFLYALVAGNAVLYKPSEFATGTGIQFEKYLYQAGIPQDVFKCVVGDAEIGQQLLELPLDGYFFTGSYKTGLHIATTVAHKLVPVQLELGGKDPLYVADDIVDIKKAAISAAEGAFYNNGQSCCAVERIYVSDKIYDQFVEAFVEEVASYKIGDPMMPDVFIGPLTRAAQLTVLDAQVKDALVKGATLRLGGHTLEDTGYYYAPTVFEHCNHDMELMKEESFGPLIGIQKVTSDDEAIHLMQDTTYGLTAAVFSADQDRAMAILEKMNTGTVYWNCCDRVSPNVPWSGRKNSGLGSTLSAQGIRAFVQPKAYHLRP
ncbi:aldehyde dehydrogenase family protein [Sphingobacterium puteale]|uniref:Aldehyde dehydrogenase family protein n=1 Tax=Sphingobacterium puteale TaxID=2420510 RepID=A0A420VQZ7_9SPHI|nr:aldehyde dehydrogenase family protein [Sphingobacterium puteale]RKO68715.1 aldehyde dehydrogenase family protein [Sphingobacterium puteale]